METTEENPGQKHTSVDCRAEEEVLYSRENARNEMHWALRFLVGPAKRSEVSSADPALPCYGRDPADMDVRGQQQITSKATASVEPT